MASMPSTGMPSFDLGHQGDFDVTLVAKMRSMTPEQRWRHHERWRSLLMRDRVMTTFLVEIARAFARNGVEYLVVGGVGAVLHGATIVTRDLDVCYRRTPENIVRLVRALAPLKPRPRGFPADLPFQFDERTVTMGCNFTLEVGDEALDLLGDMSGVGGYEQVIDEAFDMTIDSEPVKVISLRHLVATKQAAGREKDLRVLPELRRLLADSTPP